MPFFDYECECGHKWEAAHSILYRLSHCPKCDGTKIYRLISQPSMFDLKGEGFYKGGKQ